ncbi:MAG: hypothetical protein J6T10_32180 [Methanobrevibacter sp.]|nr:hypothetical protein [Methanobrevibacter sp.]
MNIIDDRSSAKSLHFSDLDDGTWFIARNTNWLNMKLNNDDCDNVFCPETSSLDYVFPATLVQPVDVDIIIRRDR